ncbi:MAG: TA0938 family protein [Thermoplasmata archaeon]|nr:TA0938 family protein [Thermoplasmata archaeon]
MKVNYAGCAICDSSWGDLWAEVEGERLFFCCNICLLQFQQLISRIKSETGWDRIDSVHIAGDRRGRTCLATRKDAAYECAFSSNAEGSLREFTSRGGTTPNEP